MDGLFAITVWPQAVVHIILDENTATYKVLDYVTKLYSVRPYYYYMEDRTDMGSLDNIGYFAYCVIIAMGIIRM